MSRDFDSVLREAFMAGVTYLGLEHDICVGPNFSEDEEAFNKWRREFGGLSDIDEEETQEYSEDQMLKMSIDDLLSLADELNVIIPESPSLHKLGFQKRYIVNCILEAEDDYTESDFQKARHENLAKLEDEAPVGVGAASSVGSEQAEDAGGQETDARTPTCTCGTLVFDFGEGNHTKSCPAYTGIPTDDQLCGNCGSGNHTTAQHEEDRFRNERRSDQFN